LLLFDALDLSIFILEESDFLFIFDFVFIIVLEFIDLLLATLELHPELLILFRQLFVGILELLNFLVAILVALLDLYHLLDDLRLSGRWCLFLLEQRLLVACIEPFVIALNHLNAYPEVI
jgi:hypothetical protein